MSTPCAQLDELYRHRDVIAKDFKIADDLWRSADKNDPAPRQELLENRLDLSRGLRDKDVEIHRHKRECEVCCSEPRETH